MQDSCDETLASAGVVARDHEGVVLLSSLDFHPIYSIVEETKLWTCLAGSYIVVIMHKPIFVETIVYL